MKNELDSKDIQILRLLLNNARLSNKEIAAKLEIAQSSAHDRIKKLTQKGYFKGAYGQIDQKKLGLNVEVILAIKLNKQHRSIIADFIEKASQFPGVIQVFHMAGDSDSEVTSPMYATAVGLVLNGLENTTINEVQEEEINEELESLTNEEIPTPKRKGFFDKWVENLKDFLDNAE